MFAQAEYHTNVAVFFLVPEPYISRSCENAFARTDYSYW